MDSDQLELSRQQGAISTFIIISVVLLLAVGGVAYIAKIRSENSQNGGPAVTQQDEENEPNDEEETPSTQEESDTPPAEEKNNTPAENENTNEQEVASTGPDIPSTGLGELVATATAVSGLGFAGTKYLSSRRRLQNAHKS